MKRLISLLALVSGVSISQAAYFSEIMYDPQGSDGSREWVEIYNDTASGVDFTSWKFFESGINHGIASYAGGTSVASSEYAVIADNPVKFLEDNPTFQGVLYDSSFSLSNSGEQLILKNLSGTAIDTVTYLTSIGGNNDGSTLSRIDGSWVRGSATPGKTNQASQSTGQVLGTATTTEQQVTIAQMSPPSADIVLYMPFEKLVVAGADAEFTVGATTRAGKNIDNLRSTWAFGDGGQATGTSTNYRYAYPGRYIAQVEGNNGQVAGIGRMIVRVVSPDVEISTIGTGKYGAYVDIANPNSYDLDLSQWKLSIDGVSFPFPKNTLLSRGQTTRFSGIAMGFASTTISGSTTARLLFPNLEEVARYVFETTQPAVLGVSTTTEQPVVYRTKLVARPVVISKSVSTTTKNLPIVQTQSTPRKDTRIVSWMRLLFNH